MGLAMFDPDFSRDTPVISCDISAMDEPSVSRLVNFFFCSLASFFFMIYSVQVTYLFIIFYKSSNFTVAPTLPAERIPIST